MIDRAAILGDGRRLEIGTALGGGTSPVALPTPAGGEPAAPPRRPSSAEIVPLDAAMKRHIEAALAATHGRIEGARGAAKLLAINPHTLRARMRKLGIEWARFREPEGGGLPPPPGQSPFSPG